MQKLLLAALLLCLPLHAARDFDAVDDSVLVNVGVVTAPPFTVCADFKVDTVAAGRRTIAFIGDKDVGTHFFNVNTDNNDLVFDVLAGASSDNATIADILTAGTWFRGCAVEASTTDRRIFVNGGNKATNATSLAPAGVDRIAAGRRMRSSPDLEMDGSIANVVIWDITLSDAEIAILGDVRGMHPCKMRSGSIVLWWPLGVASPEPDWSKNTNNGTVAGAIVADNPPNPPCWAGE